MLPVSEAIRIIKKNTVRPSTETVALSDTLGRVLAQDVVADSDLPPFDRSQMDGYAVRANDVKETPSRLQIVGESAAGRGWHQEMRAGQAVRIMTGAPVPRGADSVQQVELTRETNGYVELLEHVEVGRSIVKRGSEIKKGELVLESGTEVTAEMIAVLASFGYAQVKVGRRPRVAVVATGSELVPVNQKPGLDQIRDSNNFSIAAYAERAGAVVSLLPLAADDTNLLRKQIEQATKTADIVITSGGVSMGAYDFTKGAFRQLGAEIFFERVALRPGKPTVFARAANGPLLFGLPGNPVSVAVTFNLFARTAIKIMQGAAVVQLTEESGVLVKNVKGAHERESYLPARLTSNENGQLLVDPLKWGGSSDFVSFARATSLIIVPADIKLVEAGSIVKIVRLPA